MTEFLFITASDIHISDTNPRSRIDNFKESILDKIRQMRNACNKLGADAAIIAGDLYNIKAPTKNSHNLNRELIKEFTQFNCPIYMIVGNHDLTSNNINSLEEQPLGVLFADNTLIQLKDEKITKNEKTISLVGFPYDDNFDPEKLKVPNRDGTLVQICALHAYAAPNPGMLFKYKIHGYKEFLKLDPDIFVFGHYHLDQGIINIGKKWFINIGSMSRGTLQEEKLDHKPQIGFIKISISDNNKISYNIQSLKLKIKPSEEVFDLEKREEEKKEAQEIEFFVDKLISETVNNDISKNNDIKNIVNNFDTAKEVKEKVMYFLEKASK